MQNTAAKKRAGQEDADSDCLFGRMGMASSEDQDYKPLVDSMIRLPSFCPLPILQASLSMIEVALNTA
jgi:hypothetical protein